MSSFAVVARWVGFCQPCAAERPLVLTAYGPHGPRAWLAGYGPEDRELAYCCVVCGAREHVPATAALDAQYDATLPRWPDLVLPDATQVQAVPVELPAVPVQAAPVRAASPRADVALTAVLGPPTPACSRVRTSVVPVQRVGVADLLDLLALSA